MRRLAALFALFLLVFPAMAAGRGKNPDVVEDALAFATTDRDKAIQLLEGAIAAEADRETLARLYLYAAEQYRLDGTEATAHRYFTKVVELVDRGPDLAAARLGLTLLTMRGADAIQLATLSEVPERDALETQNADRYLILAFTAAREGDPVKAASFAKKALHYAAEDPEVATRVSAKLNALATEPEQERPADPRTAAPSMSLVEEAELALASHDADEVRRLAGRIQSTGDERQRLYAHYLEKRLEAVPTDPSTIAVLLPGTEKYDAVRQQIEEAFRLGFEPAPVKLLWLTTDADPESAVASLETAVLRKGAVAVVGPLLTQETDAVVEAANAMGVPLVSLSQALETTEGLDWVFQGVVNVPTQVDALLDHVMGTLGMKSFAVFAPNNSYGERATAHFVAGVEKRGGRIAAKTVYDAESKDLLPFAKELGRKDYEARADEFRELKQAAWKAGRDANKVVLPPVLDFDALFVPDNATRLPLAFAALAYEEFPMGEFQTSKDGPTIPLLGLASWNSESLVARGGPYARSSVFTDVYLAPSTLPAPTEAAPVEQDPAAPVDPVLSFVATYRERLGRSPTPLEVVTVDTARLVRAAADQHPKTREAFRTALLSATVDAPVTGGERFDPETRVVDWDMRLLTITKDGIFPVTPPDPNGVPMEGEHPGE